MTKQDFDKLKVGDRVILPGTRYRGITSTEVLKIDRVFNKLMVLLGGNKFLSYKYIQLKTDNVCSCSVGLVYKNHK